MLLLLVLKGSKGGSSFVIDVEGPGTTAAGTAGSASSNAPQPDDIQTTMVTTATTMLKTERDIHHRLETRRRLEGTYEDKNDVDPATGKHYNQNVCHILVI